MSKNRFFICRHCGNQVHIIHDAGVPLFCCGTKMEELIPNTVEASGEKHLPAVTVDGDKVIVNVGSVDHPMVDVHWIEWVYVAPENGGQRKVLKPGEAPHAEFLMNGEKPVAVYAYCNLHGLWKGDL